MYIVCVWCRTVAGQYKLCSLCGAEHFVSNTSYVLFVVEHMPSIIRYLCIICGPEHLLNSTRYGLSIDGKGPLRRSTLYAFSEAQGSRRQSAEPIFVLGMEENDTSQGYPSLAPRLQIRGI